MHPETEQLFALLGDIVKNLNSGGRGIGSEGNYPFRPLVWDTSEQGEFSFVKLLQTSGLMVEIELDELIQSWQGKFLNRRRLSQEQNRVLFSETLSKYQLLFETLQTKLVNLRSYKIETYDERRGEISNDQFRRYNLSSVIVGQTNDGNWVAFSQQLPPSDRAGFGKRLPKQDYRMSQAALALNEQLDPILLDLKSLIVCQFASTFDMVIEAIIRATGLLGIWYFNIFDVEQGAGNPYQYGEFEKFVASYLKNPLIYVFGNGSLYRLYIIGKCRTGDWLGALTLAVWT
ncbi:hypothetical protein H6S82_23610 [Planktothrix sp. FACHB-1355]|uniref:Uncharacterized protein n=1 Tax=Aerosakkonema funiforme FACHB-1375 TaxID=2949571 RepID=A0A926VC49_9CYAN|nr:MULTISPECIES: nuclease A inhibitor family protein [Oscillatoriales]MBD2181144.1 hypothetical protein [Aerosakkonema funiforme FACHB-1375]MBD3561808.1 hypothetical protein [Planktothrix sp. FACHB-1355]